MKGNYYEAEIEDKPISIEHLHSVILYCDFSILSTSFTKTFRQIHERESLKEIKERNKAYYHLSKYLFQTIYGYGYCPGEEERDETLYSGMSAILNMESTDLHLRGPTSTSTELVIAQNFATEDGVILEVSGGKYERRFDTPWISRYPEEAERVFMFALRSLKLVSIRININEKWHNYQTYYQVLYCVELMSKGRGIYKEEDRISSAGHGLVSERLLSFNDSIPEYVGNCWLLFINITETLNINFVAIETYPKYILSLILEGDYKKEEYDDVSNDIDLDVNINQNMVNTKFIRLFNNIATIIIQCGEYNKYYPFSLTVFVNSITNMQKRHQIKVVLKAEWYKTSDGDYHTSNYEGRSWLFYYFIDKFSNNKEYFIDYKYEDMVNDTNIYSTNIKRNKQQIKIEITREEYGGIYKYKYDIFSFIC